MRVVVSDFISLDGVVQAPGGPGDRALQPMSATPTATGVLICTYRPADR
jgi:hypothetical protein